MSTTVCYLEEAGDFSIVEGPKSSCQPVFVVAALAVDQDHISHLTEDFLILKGRIFPGLLDSSDLHHFDLVKREVKGCDLRNSVRGRSRRKRRRAVEFLRGCMDLIEKYDVRVCGRVYIKEIGVLLKPNPVYTSSVQMVCETMHRYARSRNSDLLVIADHREKALNVNVSHSIFTQRYALTTPDPYPNMIELPVFGHSDNHVGLQLADVVASGLLFPMACVQYCTGHLPDNSHVSPAYEQLVKWYGGRLSGRRYYYKARDGRMRGGFSVSDPVGRRKSSHLWSHRVKRERRASVISSTRSNL